MTDWWMFWLNTTSCTNSHLFRIYFIQICHTLGQGPWGEGGRPNCDQMRISMRNLPNHNLYRSCTHKIRISYSSLSHSYEYCYECVLLICCLYTWVWLWFHVMPSTMPALNAQASLNAPAEAFSRRPQLALWASLAWCIRILIFLAVVLWLCICCNAIDLGKGAWGRYEKLRKR